MGTAIARTAIQIGGETSQLDSAIAKSMGSLKSMVTGAVAALAVAIPIKWGLDLIKSSEAATSSMKAILGSAEVASGVLKDLKAQYGHHSKDTADGFKKLYLAGVSLEDIPPILETIVDAAKAISPDNLAGGIEGITDVLVRMKETAHVSMKDLKALGSQGINAPDILRQANGFGTVKELTEALDKGEVSTSTAIKQLLAGMQKKFSGTFKEQAENNLSELEGDIHDKFARGMKGFMSGIVNDSGLKDWMRSYAEELGAIEVVGKSAGKIIGDAFHIVGNVFQGVYTIAKTLVEVFLMAFGVEDTGLGDFLSETAKLHLNLDAAKDMALSFAEAVSMAFAIVGDKISQYLIDPIVGFTGALLKSVALILKGFSELITMGNDLASGKFFDDFKTGLGVISDKLGITDGAGRAGFDASVDAAKLRGPQPINGIQQAIDDAAKSLDGFGDKVIKHALDDFNAGDVMAAGTAEWWKAAKERFASKPISDTVAEAAGLAPGSKDKSKKQLADVKIDVAEALKAVLPTYSPNSALMAGSSEAQRAIQENRSQRDDKEWAKKQYDAQLKQVRLQQELNDALGKQAITILKGVL